jgi:multiple sugar transport system substrate-binding protein
VSDRLVRCCAVLLLLACGGQRPHAGTVLDFWALGSEGELVGPLVRAFERQEPGVHVRVQQIPWSAAHEKLLTAWVGGSMPDVFQLGDTWIPEFVALGALEPLDARIAASREVRPEDYFGGILEAARIDGRTWALPWYVDTRVLFYRSDLLARAGVRETPRTWAEWVDAFERLRRDGLARHALLLPLGEWEVPVVLAVQRGATLLRDDARFGDFESPAFRDAMRFYGSLFERGLAPRAGAAEIANLYQDFASGFFAAYVTGPWNLGEFARRMPPALAEAWSTAPIPALDAAHPSVSIAGGASLALARGSQRAELGWRLIEFLSTREHQVAFHALSGDLPPRASAWQAPSLRDDPRAQAFRIQLEHVRSMPRIPEWERIASEIGETAEAVVRGDEPLEPALARLDARTDAILEKRRWLLARGWRGVPPGVAEAAR